MNKQYKVIVNTGKAENNQVIDVAQGAGARGQGVRIKAQAGAKYQLQEIEGAKNPSTSRSSGWARTCTFCLKTSLSRA